MDNETIKAIEAMTGPTVLIAGGYDKEISFQTLAEVIIQSGRIHHCVLFGQTAPQIKEDLAQNGYHAVLIAPNLEEAVHLSANLAVEEDTVLFSPACASFDMFDDYEHRGRAFKRLVHQLKAKGD